MTAQQVNGAQSEEERISLSRDVNGRDNNNDHFSTTDEESTELKNANLCNGIDSEQNLVQQNLVPWIAIDPLRPDYNKYPRYRHVNRLVVTLQPGDVLYLPSLWFHHVQQSDDTIAVNFWYDMEYDIKYNYYKFVENLIQRGVNDNIAQKYLC